MHGPSRHASALQHMHGVEAVLAGCPFRNFRVQLVLPGSSAADGLKILHTQPNRRIHDFRQRAELIVLFNCDGDPAIRPKTWVHPVWGVHGRTIAHWGRDAPMHLIIKEFRCEELQTALNLREIDVLPTTGPVAISECRGQGGGAESWRD